MPARPEVHEPPDFAREGASGIREWKPRKRFADNGGGGQFHGSNVYLGDPEGIRQEIAERVLGLEDALGFAAECNTRLRQTRRARIMAYAHALALVPNDVGRGAAPKILVAEQKTAKYKAQEKDAELAYDLARLACRTQEAQLTAVQTAAGMLKQQMFMDGQYEQESRREMVRGAGKRMEGH